MPTSGGVSAKDIGNHPQQLLLLSPGKAARALRVARLKALYEAGLFRVDIAALARAMMRSARAELFPTLSAGEPLRRRARGLDRQACA